MGESGDKIFADLCGKPVLIHSLAAFARADCIGQIAVVTRKDKIGTVLDLVREYGIEKVVGVVSGGHDRAESVRNGIAVFCDGRESHDSRDSLDSPEYIAVHDGARPLVTPELIERVVKSAAIHRAAIPAVPVRDTVKAVKDGFVETTPKRESLYAAQTPQVFDLRLYREFMGKSDGIQVTDDSMVMENHGIRVKIVEGESRNIKITTPDDLITARGFLNETD